MQPQSRPVRAWAKVTLVDGRVIDVGVDHRDFVAYDLEYKRHGWPPAQEAPVLMQSFAFATAIVRQGDGDGLNAKGVMERIALIDEEEKPQTIFPTDAAPGPDSSSNSP